MTKRVEIYLRYPKQIELVDQGAFKELFLDAYNIFDNRDMRSMKNVLEEALEIDLTDVLRYAFLEKFVEVDMPSKSSGYWADAEKLKLQSYLQYSYHFPNLFGFNIPESMDILLEAGYYVDTDPEYGWVLYI